MNLTFTTSSGDEATKQELEDRIDDCDFREWAETRSQSLEEIADANLELRKGQKEEKFSNPYEGLSCGRQLGEPVEDFLSRLPPSRTPASQEIPWIFVANPYRKVEKKIKEGNGKDLVVEGPPEDESQWNRFVVRGNQLLEKLMVVRNEIEKDMFGRAKSTITKAINVEKDKIVKEILDTAVEFHCTSGKWMIFCDQVEVNEVWSVVARATINNELGIAAKVAPFDGDIEKSRLMCIYTKDFTDMEDVNRVVQKLKSLGLVVLKGKPIYYKCDAYTYLGINSNNEYNIKASLFDSRDFLKSKTQLAKEGKNGKINNFFYKKKEPSNDWERMDCE
ncbi:hypothetical protein HYFRA_00009950 [Hymenoscyphus fraxineus]|uniref:DUF1917-domain-containing protein n=1 Tax=Hymenoscyphus fraxineus TaxID=746836 RepID=A0A9N9L5U2_9HELO|nr:hypothetical protein HYFRA_00009950 [Hymenoscyphus fraxineus]